MSRHGAAHLRGRRRATAASFATPISYQTNMMIYGPGGYRFMDFARVGLPLNLLLLLISMIVIPMVWPT